jgi:hypothetical protein
MTMDADIRQARAFAIAIDLTSALTRDGRIAGLNAQGEKEVGALLILIYGFVVNYAIFTEETTP